jgi:alkaline phosphatase D
MTSRRRFLSSVASVAALGAAPALLPARAQPRFARDPFSLGVASGYPTPDSCVLWTRLMGDLDPAPIPVRWEVASDDSMRTLVASGTASAEPAWAHSVHVEPRGLAPDRWYWYRFRAGDAVSPIGRARTAPQADAVAGTLRLAVASCQQYEQGFFNAHRHIVADAPDLVAFVGDYIYESSWGGNHVRKHDGKGQPYTLGEYRSRHALYRGDRDLQACHAACPWIVTWDDHEVVNDYAGERAEGGRLNWPFLDRRTAAYRAFYEHMPLPARMRPQGTEMRIYTALDWGRLARFAILDDRQYRSFQACRQPGSRGAPALDVAYCAEFADPARTMLGPAQERWLEGALAESPARWNILTQQTPMAQFDQKPGPGRVAWTDGWDGYALSRKRLLDFIAARKVANPVALGGDVHSFNVNDLKADFDDPKSAVVASEFVATSITSQAWSQERLTTFLPENPHMKLVDSRFRGYLRLELRPQELRADLRAMESVTVPEAGCSTLASFVVEDGRAGPQRL